jgi:hypothetical protein
VQPECCQWNLTVFPNTRTDCHCSGMAWELVGLLFSTCDGITECCALAVTILPDSKLLKSNKYLRYIAIVTTGTTAKFASGPGGRGQVDREQAEFRYLRAETGFHRVENLKFHDRDSVTVFWQVTTALRLKLHHECSGCLHLSRGSGPGIRQEALQQPKGHRRI